MVQNAGIFSSQNHSSRNRKKGTFLPSTQPPHQSFAPPPPTPLAGRPVPSDSMKRANAKQPTVVSEGSSAPRRAIRGRSARGRPSSISQPGGPALDRYCRT